MMKQRLLLSIVVCLVSIAASANGGGIPFQITSTAFSSGGTIAKNHTCDGSDVSPPLSWMDGPSGIQSYALIADDPDAPAGTWVHWVLYNLPDSVRELPEGVPKTKDLETGARQGANDF